MPSESACGYRNKHECDEHANNAENKWKGDTHSEHARCKRRAIGVYLRIVSPRSKEQCESDRKYTERNESGDSVGLPSNERHDTGQSQSR